MFALATMHYVHMNSAAGVLTHTRQDIQSSARRCVHTWNRTNWCNGIARSASHPCGKKLRTYHVGPSHAYRYTEERIRAQVRAHSHTLHPSRLRNQKAGTRNHTSTITNNASPQGACTGRRKYSVNLILDRRAEVCGGKSHRSRGWLGTPSFSYNTGYLHTNSYTDAGLASGRRYQVSSNNPNQHMKVLARRLVRPYNSSQVALSNVERIQTEEYTKAVLGFRFREPNCPIGCKRPARPLGTITVRTYKNLHGNPSHTERFRKARLDKALSGAEGKIPINPTLSSFTALTKANEQKAQVLGYDTMIKGGVLRIGKAPRIPVPIVNPALTKSKPRLQGNYGLGGTKQLTREHSVSPSGVNAQPPQSGTLVSFTDAEKHIKTLSHMNKHVQVIALYEQIEALAAQSGSMHKPTLETVNYALHAFSARWLGARAVSLMNSLESSYNITPDATSYRHVIAACSAEGGSAFQAMHFYKAMLKAGYSASDLDLDAGLAVLGVCSEAGFGAVALEILEVLKTKTSDPFKLGMAFGDAVSACAVHGDRPRDVVYLFEEMLERSYSVQDDNMIDAMVAYADLGFSDKTLQLYGLISNKGKNVTDAVWGAAIKACHDLNWHEKALGFQVKMFRKSVTPSARTLKYTIGALNKAHKWENMLYVAELGGVCWNSESRGMFVLGFDRIDTDTANQLVCAFMHTGHLDAGENAVSYMKSLGVPLLDDTKAHILTALTTLKAYERALRLFDDWDVSTLVLSEALLSALVQSSARLNQYDLSKQLVERADQTGVVLPDHVLAEYLESTSVNKDTLETFRIFDMIYRRDLPFLHLGTVMHALRQAIRQIQSMPDVDSKMHLGPHKSTAKECFGQVVAAARKPHELAPAERALAADFNIAAENAIVAEMLQFGSAGEVPSDTTAGNQNQDTVFAPLSQPTLADPSNTSEMDATADLEAADGGVISAIDIKSRIGSYVDKLDKIAERTLGECSEFMRANLWDAKNNILDARELTKHETKAALLLIVNTAVKNDSTLGKENTGCDSESEIGTGLRLCLADPNKDLRVQVGYPYTYMGEEKSLLVNTSVEGCRYAETGLSLKCDKDSSEMIIRADRLSRWCRRNPWPSPSGVYQNSTDESSDNDDENSNEYAGKGLAIDLDGPGEVGWAERKVRVGTRDVLVPRYGKYGI